MNFDDENEVDIANRAKMKKMLTIIIVVMLLLLCAAGGIYLYAQSEKNKGVKYATLNSVKNNDLLNSFIVVDKTTYASIKLIGDVLKYKYRNGEYGKNNENQDYCYLENDFEAIEFKNGSKTIKKYSKTNKNQQPQEFEIEETVKLTNGALYLPEQGFKVGLGISFTHTFDQENQNDRFVVFTAEYLAKQAESVNGSITISEDKVEFDKEVIYCNEKAVLNNLYVVDESIQQTKQTKPVTTNNTNGTEKETVLYGVAKIETENNKSNSKVVITPRYSKVQYLEGTQDFMCTTADGKVGIIGSDGTTKIDLKFDDISIIDVENGLYLVTSGTSQGVVDKAGKMIVYENYDQIGLDDVKDSNVTNKYVLYNSVIPVKKDNKWGLISTRGEYLTQLEYDGIGCTDDKAPGASKEGVVLIPDLNGGIVLERDRIDKTVDKNGKETDVVYKYYGVLDKSGNKIVDFMTTSIYKVITRDQATYYCIVGQENYDEKIDLVAEYIKTKGGANYSAGNSSETLDNIPLEQEQQNQNVVQQQDNNQQNQQVQQNDQNQQQENNQQQQTQQQNVQDGQNNQQQQQQQDNNQQNKQQNSGFNSLF